jgi:DNA-binding transcriptional ArsR family regulator
MAKDPFLLVSLEESESKSLAQVISNDTARKILDFLSKSEAAATETDVSKKLKLPLSTVHYNLQALVKANLVVTEEFHYSEKGKEVLHYSLANQLIIMAPKKTSVESFKERLKGLLPIAIISVAAAGLIEVYTFFSRSFLSAKVAAAAPFALDSAADGARLMVAEGAPVAKMAAAAAPVAVENAAPLFTQDFFVLWFLAGSLFTLIVLAVWYYFSSRKKEK